ncbi:phosphate/phosphite/phosphonate ABC transporter substrate-binding protein [Sulfuricurvum sp.]|uniref:phosphate/phosphite/phosphonate ABC transporter substrate-binding protein n=1 Tax=Sulfuricurvum sp. TaxID=2025608 RepID=UPI003C3983FB
MNKKVYNYKFILFFLLPFFFSGCLSEEEKREHYKPSFSVIHEKQLIVGVHPYLNAEKTFLAYQPILTYLESEIKGVHFTLETSVDYADYERKLYEGHFDLSLPNPYQTLQSIQHGYRIVAKVKPDSEFRGIIVARKDRYIKTVEQLQGKAISFPAPTALAATMMPKWFLYERGLNADTQAKPKYVGSQYSSIMNAYSGDTVAAATWPSPWQTWSSENPEKAKEMELLWETPHLVNNGFVVRGDLDKGIVEQIVEHLCKLDVNAKTQILLAATGFEGFEKATNDTYIPVKEFLIRYDQTIGLPK